MDGEKKNVLPWLTPLDVAAELRVSRQTIYNLLDQGKIVWNRIGRQRRIARAELDRYIRATEVK